MSNDFWYQIITALGDKDLIVEIDYPGKPDVCILEIPLQRNGRPAYSAHRINQIIMKYVAKEAQQ